MPRKYSNIAMYKKEIFELRKQGLTNREIGKDLALVWNK